MFLFKTFACNETRLAANILEAEKSEAAKQTISGMTTMLENFLQQVNAHTMAGTGGKLTIASATRAYTKKGSPQNREVRVCVRLPGANITFFSMIHTYFPNNGRTTKAGLAPGAGQPQRSGPWWELMIANWDGHVLQVEQMMGTLSFREHTEVRRSVLQLSTCSIREFATLARHLLPPRVIWSWANKDTCSRIHSIDAQSSRQTSVIE